jgi:hypothetical protein
LVYSGAWRGGSHNLLAEVLYDVTDRQCRVHAEEFAMGDLLNRLKECARAQSVSGVSSDSATREKWPSLFEFLTAVTDGSAERTPGHIFIRWAKGEFGICLTDPDLGITAWFNCPSLLLGLDELEERLKTADLDWRVQKPSPYPRKGKGKP